MCDIRIIVHNEDGRFWAEIPALPGCFAIGDTRDELATNVREAVVLHLQALNDSVDHENADADLMSVAI